MDRTPDREAHTDSMLMWHEATTFIAAAVAIPHYRTPRLHLAAHGIELALKSHLRATGYTLDQLQRIRHSLVTALNRCVALGMVEPSDDDRHRLRFLSDAHANHEWRYAHTDKPPHMDWSDWISVAAWSLRAAIPAVATNTAKHSTEVPVYKRRMEVDVVRALNPDVD